MKQIWKLAQALACMAMMFTGSAHALLVGNIANPGVYMGTGNSNGNYTIDTNNNIEVGLRAKNRATLGVITPTAMDGTGVYQTTTGTCNFLGGCTGSTKAMWNYEFSVNTNVDGRASGGLELSGVYFQLLVDLDPTANVSWAPALGLNNWGDNDYWSLVTNSEHQGGLVVGDIGAQQSVNPMFGNSGFGNTVTPPVGGLYDIMLSVYRSPNDGNALASTHIQVQVGDTIPVPEPASFMLVILAISASAVVTTRRRKTTTKPMSFAPAALA